MFHVKVIATILVKCRNIISSFSIAASIISCLVKPSMYAYRDDSVSRTESSANCMNYISGLQDGAYTEKYTYCRGIHLKLIDSNFGQEQYQVIDYYVWPEGSAGPLLFIFPESVSLTTITLHYYSDSVRGLPRLRFYAVPDNFDVWDPPSISYPHVDIALVPPDEEPAGHRSISINFNFNPKKVLMNLEVEADFTFAASEVEFFTCSKKLFI